MVRTQWEVIQKLVHPHGPRLFDLFWRNVQPSFPIVHKPSLVDAFAKSPHESPPELIGAIFLLAAQWWAYDRDLSTKPQPDMGKLRQVVFSAITHSYHRPRLSSVQAMLLFLQCNPEDPLNPDHTFDCGLTSQVLAVSQCLGLHLDCSDWSIPEAEKQVRKRLSWALFMQDRWTALAYGRPVHIHHDDWTVDDLVEGDFSDDSETAASQLEFDEGRRSMASNGMQQFMAMIKLTQLLSSVLVGFYSARASRDQDIERLVHKADPIFAELDRWQRNIPASMSMHVAYQRGLSFHGRLSTAVATSTWTIHRLTTSCKGYLHFSYYGVMMNLLRPLIRGAGSCKNHATLSSIRQRALNTAQGAINFVGELRPDHLEAFWYFSKALKKPPPLPIIATGNRLTRYHQHKSNTIPIFPSGILHHATTCNVPLVPGAGFLAGDAELLPLAASDPEQEWADAIRSEPSGGGYTPRSRTRPGSQRGPARGRRCPLLAASHELQ